MVPIELAIAGAARPARIAVEARRARSFIFFSFLVRPAFFAEPLPDRSEHPGFQPRCVKFFALSRCPGAPRETPFQPPANSPFSAPPGHLPLTREKENCHKPNSPPAPVIPDSIRDPVTGNAPGVAAASGMRRRPTA